MQVLVVGAGVVGLAVARRAAMSGHDVIVAEGLEAESYLDTGNRSAFANHDEASRRLAPASTDPLRQQAGGARQ